MKRTTHQNNSLINAHLELTEVLITGLHLNEGLFIESIPLELKEHKMH